MNNAKISKEEFDIDLAIEKFKVKSDKHFYVHYHRKEITFSRVLSVLKITKHKKAATSFINKIFRRSRPDENILVDGEDQIDVNLAGCCQPLPGDEIEGYITKNKGITVHRKDCANLLRMISYEDRMVPVDWERTPNLYHKAQIFIDADERKNLLKDITVILAENNSGIINIEMKRIENKVNGFLTLEVNSLEQLNKIIKKLRKQKGIKSVDRK